MNPKTDREIASAHHALTNPDVPPPLRLWPGAVIVALQWLSRFVVPVVAPAAASFGVIAGLAGGLALIVWWLFFSRARWSARIGAIIVMAVALLATKRIVHPSIANGMMGMMLTIYAIPFLSLALVAWPQRAAASPAGGRSRR